MSKKNKQPAKNAAASPSQEPTTQTAAPVARGTAPSQIIKAVKKDAKFRGAREAWYQLLGKHEGKPVAEFYEAAKATPPALTKAGTAEDPRGWVRYFVRTGVLELGAP